MSDYLEYLVVLLIKPAGYSLLSDWTDFSFKHMKCYAKNMLFKSIFKTASGRNISKNILDEMLGYILFIRLKIKYKILKLAWTLYFPYTFIPCYLSLYLWLCIYSFAFSWIIIKLSYRETLSFLAHNCVQMLPCLLLLLFRIICIVTWGR